MSEQEIIKRSRKIYRLWQAPISFKHKTIEFGIEIIVIVFAISFSLLLERWRGNEQCLNI